LFVLTPHPVAHGRRDADWIMVGEELRLQLAALPAAKRTAGMSPHVFLGLGPRSHLSKRPQGAQ
jgi:hypothetical protein